MSRSLKGLLAIVVAALVGVPLLLAPPKPVHAAASILCSPQIPGNAMARQIGGTLSSVPSGTVYTLNGQGCTVVQQQDVSYFLSQGFTAGPPFGTNVIFTTGVATGTTSFQIGQLPAGTYIQHIIANNTTANAVTGGIGIGSTSNGTDIVAPANFACAANCLAFVTDANLAKRVFSATTVTPIFATANGTSGSWNSANVTLTVVFGYF